MIRLEMDNPTVKQEQFLKARTKHIGFGGARGGGKSWSVRTKAVLLAINYAGIHLIIIRRTYPELLNNHINTLRSQLKGVAKYNSQEKEFKFDNGSCLKFGYCSRDGDLLQYQGAEYDCIFFDEATQLTEFQMKSITACLRGVNSYPKRVYYTCNPGGAGHQYIKRIFIDKQYVDGENPEDYTFIQSLATDNIALMQSQPDYIKQLEALPARLREAWLYGKWDVFEGAFFSEFRDVPEEYESRNGTHVIAPFEVPKGWTIYRSFDWGYSKPFSCGWWAVDYDGTLYRILELYGCTAEPNNGVKWTPEEVFKEIHRVETEHPWLNGRKINGIADPAIWDKETGESIADTAAKFHVWFSPGDHARIPGWLQVRYRFQFDENGKAGMYIFSNCKAFIRTIPLMQFSETRVEDLDTSLEDHVADEVRYMCMARPISPRLDKSDNLYYQSPLHTVLDIPKGTLKRRPTAQRMEIIRDAEKKTD